MLEKRSPEASCPAGVDFAVMVLDLQAWEDGRGGTIQEAKGRSNPRYELKPPLKPAMVTTVRTSASLCPLGTHLPMEYNVQVCVCTALPLAGLCLLHAPGNRAMGLSLTTAGQQPPQLNAEPKRINASAM